MKKLSLGIQTFSKVINGNCVYVDKTEYIYNLIQGNCYFLARPRRFGKSLLCSTLEDLFLGNKELFKGLWIYEQSDFDWQKHPVIHIDFLLIAHKTPTELIESLMRYLDDIAEDYDVGPLAHTTPGEMLKKLTIKLMKKYGGIQKVVLIIDEYDKAILEHIHDAKTAHIMREILKSFYEFIKGLVCIFFCFSSPNLMNHCFGSRLELLRQFVENISRFMNPTSLPSGFAINLIESLPKT